MKNGVFLLTGSIWWCGSGGVAPLGDIWLVLRWPLRHLLFFGHFRRCHPPPSPPKYPKSPRSPASTFPHSIQLLLDCLPSARLVSISPRWDYFCTFAHGKFLASPTRSNSATAVTSCGDSLSHAGKPLGLQMGILTRLVNTRRSNRHNSRLSTVSILQQFLTPERLYVLSPATS